MQIFVRSLSSGYSMAMAEGMMEEVSDGAQGCSSAPQTNHSSLLVVLLTPLTPQGHSSWSRAAAAGEGREGWAGAQLGWSSEGQSLADLWLFINTTLST